MLAFGFAVSANAPNWSLAAFRDLLVGLLYSRLGVKLLFDMNNYFKFPGMIRGGQECYADAMLPKLSYSL